MVPDILVFPFLVLPQIPCDCIACDCGCICTCSTEKKEPKAIDLRLLRPFSLVADKKREVVFGFLSYVQTNDDALDVPSTWN